MPTPISRCPKEASFRLCDPCSRNTVIAAVIIAVAPIPGCPDITLAWAHGLRVNRQRRGSDGHPQNDLSRCHGGRCGYREKKRDEKKPTCDSVQGNRAAHR